MKSYLVGSLFLGICVSSSATVDKIFILLSPHPPEVQEVILITVPAEKKNEETDVRCTIVASKDPDGNFLRASAGYETRSLDIKELEQLLKECTMTEQTNRRHRDIQNSKADEAEGTEERLKIIAKKDVTSQTWNLIFPGTKWCGAGDAAKSYDDLGVHIETDKCCREHDNCFDYISAGETKYNLTNRSVYTREPCKCDHDFFDCLIHTNSSISDVVGNIYFNILGTPCYEKLPPLTCKKYLSFMKLICVTYGRNTSASEVYQWIPARAYRTPNF